MSWLPPKGFPWKLEHLLPKVLLAGDKAGVLTEEGAKKLDPTGTLQAGCRYARRKVTPEPVW